MRKVELLPQESSDHGTISRLTIDDEPFSYTMEPPDRGNEPNRSCIPEGVYVCTWHYSPRYKWVYLVTDVPGRAWILMHPGNIGGDREKGLSTHTLGCILPGRRVGSLEIGGRMQRAVLASRPTVGRFFNEMNKQDFALVVNRQH